MDKSELVDIIQSRHLTYAFLSRVYAREVKRDFLEKLVSVYQNNDALSEESKLNKIANNLKNADLDKMEETLAVDYCGLFLMGESSIAPYESIQSSPDNSLVNTIRDSVIAEYRQEGLGKIEDFKEPEDHIAIEFEYMSFLCQKAIDSLKSDDFKSAYSYLQKQKAFFGNHLLKWVPGFCKQVEEHAETDFYKGFAQFTREYLDVEKDTLKELSEILESELETAK